MDKPVEPKKIRIAMVGDFLIHSPVIDSARDPRTGKYDFKEIFKEIRQYLSQPDFTVANLETRFAGPAKGYCGYPLFNCPSELAYDMKELGIDLVATANNHSMDMGKEGVITTLDNLDRAGLRHMGNYRSAAERERPAVFEIGGIRVGFINYAQDTNGIPVPSGSEYLVNLIRRDLMQKEIKNIKASGADLIIAYIHFGTEYQRHPNELQKTLARELFESGVDVVAGAHPHVLQPMEWQKVRIGGREKNVLAAYSLGNFISNQQWRHSDCGIILNIDIVKSPDGVTSLAGAGYIPVWVHRYTQGLYRYRLLPMEKAIRDYEEKKDPLLTRSHYLRLKEALEDTRELMGPDFRPGP
ncbi:MAG: CapA family protein [Bacillota bacterium]